MASATDIVVQYFHALEGLTVADKRRNFFKLLHQNKSLNPQEVQALTAVLTPTTYLQSLFKLDFLIYFKCTQDLLQILKEGNEVFVSKIVKQSWFFTSAFSHLTAEDLVNEVLPNMSYCVRMKVLRQCSRYLNNEAFDLIFDAVAARYGRFIASSFITGCSPAKMKQILLDSRFKLTTKQLKIMHGKDASLIDIYFEHVRSNVHNNFLKYLYTIDRDLFKRLALKYKLSLNLGRRNTKKFIEVQKEDVVNNPYAFGNLNMRAAIRKLGKDALRLFCNALPRKLEDLDQIRGFLHHFPKKYRYSLYVTAVENHYNMKFVDHPDLITESVLKLVPDGTQRLLFAKVKVSQGHDDYLKFLTTEDSIPRLKEKINLTSNIHERGKLIRSLVETCHLNKDIAALVEVMKYFCFRHKNDDICVHLQFINNIESFFGFKVFTEEMWTCLNELLLVHMLKYGNSEKLQRLPLVQCNLGVTSHQKLSYLEFLFNKMEPIDELLEGYFASNSSFPSWGLYDKNFEKHVLLFSIKRVTCTEECLPNSFTVINQIDKWNLSYKHDQIFFYNYPILHSTYIRALKKQRCLSFETGRIFKKEIFTTESSTQRDEHLRIYWERIDNFKDIKDFQWFLKFNPSVLCDNIQVFAKIATNLASHRLRFWHLVKKYGHLQKKLLEYYQAELNSNDCVYKQDLIPCLSVLMSPEDFIQLADSYAPATKKLDVKNEVEVKRYNIQCSIAHNFKNTRSQQVLASLLKYCAGDYFKNAMTSLYSILYHTPENALPKYLNHLSQKAVSVRKHALYLTCELCTVSEVEKVIKMLNETETVQSLQKQIFGSTIKYFVKNPCDQFFQLVKLNMAFIRQTDEESLDSVIEILTKIPAKYKSAYILFSWEYLEKTVEASEILQRLQQGLLDALSRDIIRELPLEFCLKIVQDQFLTKVKDRLKITHIMFDLAASRDEKSAIFAAIFAKLDGASREQSMEFFNTWYNLAMEFGRNEALSYLEPYVNYVDQRLELVPDFSSCSKLFFLKVQMVSPSVEEFTAKIVPHVENLLSSCGPYVLHLFAKEMKTAITYFVKMGVTKYDYYYHIIRNHPVPGVAMLILSLLSNPSINEVQLTFYNILKLIQSVKDVGVQIHLQHYYGEYLSAEEFTSASSNNMEVDA